ncbi:MAG: 2-oxoglutarate dehydrogenase E1 component [Deltaproteobacteria bacterium]|nr:2-oxoglutarate dehydrogenase E1 component [Deltaproteobacteria bacterium]
MNRDFGINQAIVEEMYLRFVDNPQAVEEHWRKYFETLPDLQPNGHHAANVPATHAGGQVSHEVLVRSGTAGVLTPSVPPVSSITDGNFGSADSAAEASAITAKAAALVSAFRSRGHFFAKLDPLGLEPAPPSELTAQAYGLSEHEQDARVSTNFGNGAPLTVRELLRRCEATYCGSIAVEYMDIESTEEREWLRTHMESTLNRMALSHAQQRHLLSKLTDAEVFEQFLHTKYIGAKRFSCEGSESIVPMVDLVVEETARLGGEEIVIGMAHRGRLNVLVNILGKPVREILAGFEDKDPEKLLGRGDVKYHMGYSNDRVTSSGHTMHLTLAFNPSHLEFVGAVVEGRVRAKQDRAGGDRRRVLPLVLHGDAAVIGQGIVAETLNLMNLEGYTTGGTIHIVINNQVGFTTSPSDSRSTRYCTDITRLLKMPVFHVNGEDPEAVAWVTMLAVEYRQRFGKDVCIDLFGYRKYGHNEGDEPRFTQPLMYAAIEKREGIRKLYADHLVAAGTITRDEAQALIDAKKALLETELEVTRADPSAPKISAFKGLWEKYRGGLDRECPEANTAVSKETLTSLVEQMQSTPVGFTTNPKISALWRKRLETVQDGKQIDWATGECLTFASLLSEGAKIRLSGQDARRGTFSHRHATLTDSNTAKRYSPYSTICSGSASLEVFDSPLSEAGVMGFDYGFSLDYPDALVIWEGQFGDFGNGAQVIIDQFLSAAEDKWSRLSGLTLLLPHGFEGAGPEHSSARLERFLQLGAEDNMFVCNLTTAAQLFHALRRQVHRAIRKPLVVMTPKSMLRTAYSSIDEFTKGGFQRVIADGGRVGDVAMDPAKVTRILLCSGKVYYDLLEGRAKRNRTDVAIVRLEQLYPLSEKELTEALRPYKATTPVVWVQEEPWNMGAWYFLAARLPKLLGPKRPMHCVARAESASPATGSSASHKIEQALLIDQAFEK